MTFGNCQVDFIKLALMKRIVTAFLSVPKPDIAQMQAKGTWVNAYMKDATTKFEYDGSHLIYTAFNLTGKQWVAQMTKILDELKVAYTHEPLKSGMYTNDVFIISKQHALNIASLRRGGRGVLMVDMAHLNYMRNEDKLSRDKAFKKKAVLDALTPDQRRALGI